MAPSKAPSAASTTQQNQQLQNARKKSGTPSTPRPPVTVALPMTMEQRQLGKHAAAAVRKSNSASAKAHPAVSPPRPSLDAALINQDGSSSSESEGGGGSTRAPQSTKPSDHQRSHGPRVEKPADGKSSAQEPASATQTRTKPHTGAEADTPGAHPNGTSPYAPAPNGINGHSSAQQTPRAVSQLPSTELSSFPADASGPAAPGIAQQVDSTTSPRRSDPAFASMSHVIPLGGPPPDRHPEPQVANHPSHQMHLPRMSNGGGLVFGGFRGSHTPSPAPPNGSFIPPASMPLNNDVHGFGGSNGHSHTHSGSPGFAGPVDGRFHHAMPPPGTNMESYSQIPAPVPQGPYDGYPPSNSSRYGPPTPLSSQYGPPTPHSFHGSQGSVEPTAPDGNLPFHPPNGMPYPGRGPHDHPGAFPPHAGLYPPLPPGAFHPRAPFIDDSIIDGLVHIKSQFNNTEASDCVLELVSSNGLFSAVTIPGHKLILGRSPTLRAHMRNSAGEDVHTLTITSTDRFLRPEAWWMAIQRLYMHPLLDVPPMPDLYAGAAFVGDNRARLDFGLAYAAAGHALNVREVLIRGLHVARRFISMETVETALRFILDGTSQRHTEYEDDSNGTEASFVTLIYSYGPETKILMDAVVRFLLESFPVNFELDESVAEGEGYSRIPAIPGLSGLSSSSAAPIARGSAGHKSAKSGRNIKFGDLPSAYSEEQPQIPRERAPLLSRVLLGLPFDVLRAVLTPESIGQPGWDNAQARHYAAASVVAEREKRRLRAVEAVRKDAVPGSREIKQRLSAHRRHAIVEDWDVLNWREEIIHPLGENGPPRLVRRWVSQFPVAELDAEPYNPPERPHNLSQSMV